MRENRYIVTFVNGKTVFVSTFNEEDASVLASAIMIKNGFTRDIESVKQTTNISDMADTDFIA